MLPCCYHHESSNKTFLFQNANNIGQRLLILAILQIVRYARKHIRSISSIGRRFISYAIGDGIVCIFGPMLIVFGMFVVGKLCVIVHEVITKGNQKKLKSGEQNLQKQKL